MNRIFPFALAALLGGPVHAAGFPDSGQALCYNGSDTLTACNVGNSGDASTYPRQDGRFGRDAKATAGALTKTGAGVAGFDYTKVANNGSDLPAGATLGNGAGAWACTRDNVTGLTWEVKTTASTDLRYFNHVYYWYSTDSANNGGNAGSAGSNTCNGTLPGNLCNTQAFAAAVNNAALCGYTDWRLPTLRELDTLSHFGRTEPSIDTTYFPNTDALSFSSLFWTATTKVPDTSTAWAVYYFDGQATVSRKSDYSNVRLVRGASF